MSEQINTSIKVSVGQAKPLVLTAMYCGLVAMLHGSPAIGKSSIVHQVAEQENLKVIDLRLSQCDPTDLLGFPQINPVTGKAGYAPMETFPIMGDKLPVRPVTDDPNDPDSGRPYQGWLLFLDELTSAPPAVQAAAYKLILDRMVGQHHLHKNVVMVAAGNLESDNAVVHPMSTALQSRLVHLVTELNAKEWIDWASVNGIDYRITSYINFKPSALYTFSPEHTDKTYGAPRTWEFQSRLMKKLSVDSDQMIPLASGTVSEGVAREFLTFCKIFDQLPTIKGITDNPEAIPVPREPSILFALTGSIGAHADATNIGQLMKFIKRMPVEFQVVCLRDAIRRSKPLMTTAPVREWISGSAAKLF